jgi:hypothetical protein
MAATTTTTGHALSAADWLDIHYLARQPEYEAILRRAGFQAGWHVLDAGLRGRQLSALVIRTMQFNALGGQGTWTSLFPPNGQFAGNHRFSVENLRTMVEIGPGEYYLFANGADITGPGLAAVFDYFTLVDVSGVRRWMEVAGVYPSYVAAFNWPGTPNVYVLFYGSGGVQYRLINRNPGGDPTLTAVFPPIPSLETVPLMSGEPPANWRGMFLVQRTNGIHRATFAQAGNSSLTEASVTRVAPRLEQPLAFTEELSEAQLQERHAATQRLHDDNAGGPNTNLVYWAEGCYFVPISIALQLQRVGEYVAALDWFRTVYDFTAPPGLRKIYYGLRREATLASSFQDRVANWLLDPLNPHEIAATRQNAYTRYTLLSLIRCLLDYADAEFTRDTAESVPRARILYTTALELLEANELKQKVGECEALIGSIDIEMDYPRWVPIQWLPVWNGLVRRLRNIGEATRLAPAVQQIRAALAENRPWSASGSWRCRRTKKSRTFCSSSPIQAGRRNGRRDRCVFPSPLKARKHPLCALVHDGCRGPW